MPALRDIMLPMINIEGGASLAVDHKRLVRMIGLLVCVLLTTSCASRDSSLAPERVPKVLLIGIDGVRPDVLAEVPTPNLDALAAEGLFVANARTTTPSVSGPSWSSMLTGVWPEKHGVTNNDFTGRRFEEFPDFLTRLERVRPELSTVAIVDWAPLMERDEEGAPTISDAVDGKHTLDGYELGWPQADARSTDIAVEVLTNGSPDALFVYLGNPDETSHAHGSIGAEYRAAIAEADAQVGRIVAAVRARRTYAEEDWLILSSTDHGRRADGGHGGDSAEEMTIYLLASGGSMSAVPTPDSAFIVDVAVTALSHLGVESPPEWRLDGTALGGR